MVPDINLLPKTERKSSNEKWLFITIAIIFCAFLIFVIVQSRILSNQLITLEQEQQTLALERESLLSEIEALNNPKEVDLETSVQFIEHIAYAVSPIIVEVNKGLDPHAYLREYSFLERAVQLKVDFETIPEVVSYVDYLTRSKYFDDVLVNQITTFDPVLGGMKRIRFMSWIAIRIHLTCRWN